MNDVALAEAVERACASIALGEATSRRRPLVVDVLEALRGRDHELPWRDFVMERISRFCASYFDDGQAQVRAPRGTGFYATWRDQAESDHMPSLFMGLG